jgi:hypothetical protein
MLRYYIDLAVSYFLPWISLHDGIVSHQDRETFYGRSCGPAALQEPTALAARGADDTYDTAATDVGVGPGAAMLHASTTSMEFKNPKSKQKSMTSSIYDNSFSCSIVNVPN